MAIVLSSMIGLAGCKKQEVKPPPPVANGAQVDLAKLRDVLATNTDADVQKNMDKVASGLRYGYDYEAVLEALDKLSNSPSVTPPQKQVVGEVIEQVKQFVSHSQPGQ